MENITPQNDETPTSDQASGVSGEQLSFFPTPEFCPILPPHVSAAMLTLMAVFAAVRGLA
jgi:hypothetical protein